MDYLEPLIQNFISSANFPYSVQMEKYLKGKFPFLGLRSAQMLAMLKDFIKASGLPPRNKLSDTVLKLWELPEREYQHAAIIIFNKFSNKFEEKDIELIEKLITDKSWWDTVDGLAVNTCGAYFKLYPYKIKEITGMWMDSQNMWLQRSSLLFQLKYKKTTDTEILSGYIQRLADSGEFFIRKAIGWILREYSKSDPDWVRNFVQQNKLSGLSYREATKYI